MQVGGSEVAFDSHGAFCLSARRHVVDGYVHRCLDVLLVHHLEEGVPVRPGLSGHAEAGVRTVDDVAPVPPLQHLRIVAKSTSRDEPYHRVHPAMKRGAVARMPRIRTQSDRTPAHPGAALGAVAVPERNLCDRGSRTRHARVTASACRTCRR